MLVRRAASGPGFNTWGSGRASIFKPVETSIVGFQRRWKQRPRWNLTNLLCFAVYIHCSSSSTLQVHRLYVEKRYRSSTARLISFPPEYKWDYFTTQSFWLHSQVQGLRWPLCGETQVFSSTSTSHFCFFHTAKNLYWLFLPLQWKRTPRYIHQATIT